MRCIACHKLSKDIVCPQCRDIFLSPGIHRRKIGTLDVVSLFGYKEIEPFILSKHTSTGYRIYKFFGKFFIAPFIEEFAKKSNGNISIVTIDDNVKSGYSHTALLTHSIVYPSVEVLHSALLATNRVNYAGKSLEFRLQNPRNFRYNGKASGSVILVDDIITTGTTLQEAHTLLRSHGVDVLLAMTLADAKF